LGYGLNQLAPVRSTIQTTVQPVRIQQLLVRTLLGNPSVFENVNLVSLFDRAQPVRWALRELVVIIWSSIKNGDYWSALRAKRYRLSTGAALVGVCSGFLYLIHGRWAYSSQIIDHLTDNQSTQSVPGMVGIGLFLALLTGAVASAISSRQFGFTFAKNDWHKNLIGGFLMGFGAIMIPGGNAKLILQDIPQLSTHAISAYLAMVLGITLTLLALRRFYGEWEIVNCSGHTCKISRNK